MQANLSDVSICNSALAKLGADRITSLEQDTRNARICRERFPFLRNEVLRAHVWGFAKKRVSLAASSDTPDFGWDYAYLLPSDCLRVIREDYIDVDFDIEGRYILTDNSTFDLIYIFEETNSGNFDYMFAEALATRLAADISYVITQSNTMMTTMMQAYASLIRDARFVSASEKTPAGPTVDVWINSRF
jgi:hypothetical protein